jgi:hypothetical protein
MKSGKKHFFSTVGPNIHLFPENILHFNPSLGSIDQYEQYKNICTRANQFFEFDKSFRTKFPFIVLNALFLGAGATAGWELFRFINLEIYTATPIPVILEIFLLAWSLSVYFGFLALSAAHSYIWFNCKKILRLDIQNNTLRICLSIQLILGLFTSILILRELAALKPVRTVAGEFPASTKNFIEKREEDPEFLKYQKEISDILQPIYSEAAKKRLQDLSSIDYWRVELATKALTRVKVLANSAGLVMNVQTVDESGIPKFDTLAIEVFKTAKRLPEPPKKFLLNDQLELYWNFILE